MTLLVGRAELCSCATGFVFAFFYCLDGGYASCLEIPTCYLDFFLPHLLTLCADCWHQDPFVPDTATFLTYIDRFSLSYLRATSPRIELLFVNGHISSACFEPFRIRCSFYNVQYPAGSQAVTRHAKPVESSLADLENVALPVNSHRPPPSLPRDRDRWDCRRGLLYRVQTQKSRRQDNGRKCHEIASICSDTGGSAEDHARLGRFGGWLPRGTDTGQQPKDEPGYRYPTDDGTMSKRIINFGRGEGTRGLGDYGTMQ